MYARRVARETVNAIRRHIVNVNLDRVRPGVFGYADITRVVSYIFVSMFDGAKGVIRAT